MSAAVTQPAISAHTRLCAVIGDPVRHSLSPTIHNAAFKAAGLDIRYLALHVPHGSGNEAIAAFRSLGLLGMSVTTPHKFDVANAVDRLTPGASLLQSCNTIFRDAENPEVVWGASTDGDGFFAGLAAEQISLVGAHVVIVGAGGAGRSIIEATSRTPIASITVLNRDYEKAVSAARLSPKATARPLAANHELPLIFERSDVVINATTLGMRPGDQLPIAASLIAPRHVVADAIYHPAETELLRHARTVGARTINGLPMLLHQACMQFTLWTGQPAPLSAMRDALQLALESRRD